jgi:Flp pilus assembly protein TadG
MQLHAQHDSRSAFRGRLAKLGVTGLQRSRSGIAALEFALIAPVLVTVCAGLYDLTTAFLAWQRVNMAALAIAQITTYQAANSNNTNMNILNLAETRTGASAIYAYLPNTLSASPPGFGVTISSIAMVPTPSGCTVNCTYTAHVAWSGIFQGSGSRRPCDARSGVSALNFVPDGSNPTPQTLPTDLQSTGQPLLVVDVNYTFQPLFFTFITGNIMMMGSAYFPPRTGLPSDWVQYYLAGSSDPTIDCPGYPWSTINP